MSSSKTPSAEPEVAPMTPEQRFEAEKRLARLIIVKEEHGVDAAMEEWERMKAEMKEKDQNSPKSDQG